MLFGEGERCWGWHEWAGDWSGQSPPRADAMHRLGYKLTRRPPPDDKMAGLKEGADLIPDQNIRQKINQGRKLSRLITLSINSTWLALLKPDEELGMTGMWKSFFYDLFSEFWVGPRGGGVTPSKMSLYVGVSDSSEASHLLGLGVKIWADEVQHRVLVTAVPTPDRTLRTTVRTQPPSLPQHNLNPCWRAHTGL